MFKKKIYFFLCKQNIKKFLISHTLQYLFFIITNGSSILTLWRNENAAFLAYFHLFHMHLDYFPASF